MYPLFGYLAATGLVTSAAVLGRGLVRSIRHLADGEYGKAGAQALSALAAPVLLAQAATAAMVLEAVAGANELVGDVLEMSPLRQE